MKTIKPTRLSLLTRSFEINRTYRFGVSTFVYFDLRTGQVLPEAAMWLFAAEELGKEGVLDLGIPKSNAEYLIKGSVFTPGGQPQETCPVTIRVGRLEKTVYVVGDRFWKGRTQSKPQPFTQMSLEWGRAFGGEGFAKNPLGKGFAPVETEHGPIQFLPNLESPGKMITRPKDTPDPVGVGPVDQMWPQRYSKVGTYDEKWLKTDFPGFARDMDWSFHNLAPLDQQQREFFTGIERFEITNMHPSEPRILGQLPGLRARTFVTQRQGRAEKFLEIDTNLTTFWIFPHALKGILVFHGSIPASDDDGSDIVHLLIAAERLGQDRGVPHYQEVLAKRLDRNTGVAYALRDEDLLPAEVMEGEVSDPIAEAIALLTPEGLLKKNLDEAMRRQFAEARELIAAHGLDPDEHGPPAPESLSEEEKIRDPVVLFKRIEELRKEADELKERAEAEAKAIFERQRPKLEAAGIDPAMIEAEMNAEQYGPPEWTAAGELARITALRDQCVAMGMPVDELEEWVNDETLHERWRKAEASLLETYRLSAHLQSRVPPLPESESERARNEVLERYLAGGSFVHFDLSGANLSGLDLRGADFRQGWLESVDFTGADLSGANFAEAVLAGAKFIDATLEMTNFRDANLGSARFERVKGKGNNFTGAVLNKTEFEKADFADAELEGVTFMETNFSETGFAGLKGKQLFFIKCQLENVNFSKSELSQAGFVECSLGGADFYGASLSAFTCVDCSGRSINFCESNIDGFSAVQCKSFAECDFRGAKIKMLYLRGVDLRKSDFSAANLEKVDLSEADLREAKFYRTVTRDTLFVKTNLQDANMTSADLLRADLQKADIRGTQFIGANLYGANFGRVYSDNKTNLTEANQLKVTIYPLRHE